LIIWKLELLKTTEFGEKDPKKLYLLTLGNFGWDLPAVFQSRKDTGLD
jgi:hypothetical protein